MKKLGETLTRSFSLEYTKRNRGRAVVSRAQSRRYIARVYRSRDRQGADTAIVPSRSRLRKPCVSQVRKREVVWLLASRPAE